MICPANPRYWRHAVEEDDEACRFRHWAHKEFCASPLYRQHEYKERLNFIRRASTMNCSKEASGKLFGSCPQAARDIPMPTAGDELPAAEVQLPVEKRCTPEVP